MDTLLNSWFNHSKQVECFNYRQAQEIPFQVIDYKYWLVDANFLMWRIYIELPQDFQGLMIWATQWFCGFLQFQLFNS